MKDGGFRIQEASLLWNRTFVTMLKAAGPRRANKIVEEFVNVFMAKMGDGEVEIVETDCEEVVPSDDPKEKWMRLDIRARAEGLLYDIEVQLARTPDLVPRMINYVSRLRGLGLRPGMRHDRANKVRLICLCGFKTGFDIPEGSFCYPVEFRCGLEGRRTDPLFSEAVKMLFIDLVLAEKLWNALLDAPKGLDLWWTHTVALGVKEEGMFKLEYSNMSEGLGLVKEVYAEMARHPDLMAALERQLWADHEYRSVIDSSKNEGKEEQRTAMLRHGVPELAGMGLGLDKIAQAFHTSVEEVRGYL